MAKETGQADTVEEIDYEAVAKSLLRLGQAAAAMQRSGLGERAIHILIRDMTGVGMDDIKRVLWAARTAPSKYLTADFIKKNSGK